jgi:hypothetical protein
VAWTVEKFVKVGKAGEEKEERGKKKEAKPKKAATKK